MKIITWNIQSGGAARIPRIVAHLADDGSDVVVLMEYRPYAASGDRLREALRQHGWRYQEEMPQSSERHAVLAASRTPLVRVEEDLGLDLPADLLSYARARWVEVRVPAWTVPAPDPLADPLPLTIAGVHVPGSDDKPGLAGKAAFWDALLDWAARRSTQPAIMLGDFNSGLRIDEGGPTSLDCKRHLLRLCDELGWHDASRVQHGETREYTYYSRQGGGYHLDHAWLSPVVQGRLRASTHQHHVRAVHKLSDHSALSIEIKVDGHAA